jgi:hypothetical protein
MKWQAIDSSAQAAAIALTIKLFAAGPAEAQSSAAKAPACQISGDLAQIPELREGSGIAASRKSGRFWSHNDSGEPILVALDSSGKMLGQIHVSGAAVEDWEAIAVGPCPEGSCIYIGDIGDNDASRSNITIYRLPEPADVSGSVQRSYVIRARYPDGSHDAESLVVTPKGDILIVTKGDTGPIGLYRLPSGSSKSESIVTMEAVGKPRDPGREGEDRITDAAISPNGEWLALRSNNSILIYRTSSLLAGDWQEASRISLQGLREPQGEGITFGDETTLFLVGEGGGKSRPGTFGQVTCTF